MKKLYLALLFLSSLTASAQMPSFRWAITQPANFASTYSQSVVNLVAATPASGVISTNLKEVKRAYSSFHLGPLEWYAYDAAGNLQWSRSWPGNTRVTQLRVGASGNIFVTGTFLDSLRLGPQHLLQTSGPNSHEAYLACLDATGQVLWVKNLSQLYGNVMKNDGMALDGRDNVYVAYTVGISNNSFIRKFDAAGNPVQVIAQTGVPTIFSLDVDARGNIFASGACVSNNGGQFGGVPFSPQVSGNGYNKFVVRYRPSGVPSWVAFAGDVTCSASQVKADKTGGAYWVGIQKDNASFGPHPVNGPLTGSSADFFISRLDSAGNFLWARDLPPSQNSGGQPGKQQFMAVDNLNNLLLTGSHKGSINWGNGIQTTSPGTTSAVYDLLVLQCSEIGTVNWVKTTNSTGGLRYGHGLALAPNGSVFVSGLFNMNATLDTISLGGTTNYIPFVARLGGNNQNTSPLGVSTNIGKSDLQLFPNPATEELTLQPGFLLQNATISVMDLNGKVVQKIQVAAEKELKLLVKNLPAGLYLVSVESKEKVQVARFMKQ